ncbi:MAG: cupin [Sphingobium sp.]
MPINKLHDEFHALDMATGWEVPPGYPSGIQQKILAGALDEDAKSGSRTRFLRFAPGAFTTEPFVHEYWEEVLLVSGDLSVHSAAGDSGQWEGFDPYTYACRPPGAYHGPFRSEHGCLLVEIHYYDPA